MAAATEVSKSTVQQVWSARGLKPHRVETCKLSNDPKFEDKLVDVVGLYLNPPQKAIVLCADEKSSVQALDRTQASLPMVKGRGETMTHDYKRHGTTTLFAALDVLTGKVIGQCLPRHRHEEFLIFLKTIDAEVPKNLQVHLILDNYSTHKHPDVATWLGRHKRFHLHFTPTSSSWLNLGRTLVPRPHRTQPAPRNLRQRPRPHRQYRDLPRGPQRPPKALRVDRDRRRHPRQGPARPYQARRTSQSKLRRTTSFVAWAS